jgi:hypothetical protein
VTSLGIRVKFPRWSSAYVRWLCLLAVLGFQVDPNRAVDRIVRATKFECYP